MKPLPSQEYLRGFLIYHPSTGVLFWKHRPGHTSFNNRDAGTKALTAKTKNGYLHGHIMGEKYLAHRVAWKMHYGTDPGFIDHINHDKTDNRIANLRSVSKRENCRNTNLGSKNTSGVVGVVWDKSRNKWTAQIKVDGKNHYLGRFDTFEAAVRVRKQGERLYGFHENHGGSNAA